MKEKLMGEHWNATAYPKLYQLSRRVERVARELESRRKNGWVASSPYIAELNDISNELKALDVREASRGRAVPTLKR
jgi:hypothetical protein